MPFTAKLYKQWWSEFFKWLFMGPIAVTILALGSVIASGSFGFTGGMTLSGDSTIPGSDTTGWNVLIGLMIFGASIYFAATLPQKWGGGIMKGWQKAGKWGRDNVLPGKYVKQGWKDFTKARGDRGMLRYNEIREGLANKVPGGRLLTGTNKAQATALKEGIDKTYEGMFGKLDAIELGKNAKAGGRKGMIATSVMQKKYGDGTKAWALPGQLNADGTWNTNDPEQRKQWDDESKDRAVASYTTMMAQDRDFLKSTIEDNPEMALKVARETQRSNPQLSSQIAGEVNSVNAGKSWSQKNRKQVGAVTEDFEAIKGAYEQTDPKRWSTMQAVATNAGDAAGQGGPEYRTARLMELGLSSYEAGQMVAAADLHKSWKEQVDRGQSNRIIANSDDKRKGTIESFAKKVVFDENIELPTQPPTQPNDPSDNYQI
jgi:hypothetical protein